MSPRGDTCRPTVAGVLEVVDRHFPGERVEIDLGRLFVHATLILRNIAPRDLSRLRLIQIATLKARIMLMRNEMARAFPRFPIVVSVIRR